MNGMESVVLDKLGQLPAIYWLIGTLLSGGGIGALVWGVWDRWRRDRNDSFGHLQEIIAKKEETIQSKDEEIAQKEAAVAETRNTLEGERRSRFQAEDAAAEYRRRSELLEQNLEHVKQQNHALDEILERNRELRQTNGKLLRHVYACEQKTAILETNISRLKQAVERQSATPPDVFADWTPLDDDLEAPLDLDDIESLAESSDVEL